MRKVEMNARVVMAKKMLLRMNGGRGITGLVYEVKEAFQFYTVAKSNMFTISQSRFFGCEF